MRNFLSYIVIAGVSVALVGCNSNRKPIEEDIVVEQVGGSVGSSDGTATGLGGSGETDVTGLDGDGGTGSEGLDGNANLGGADAALLAKRVVYFEYNSSLLTLEGEAVVQAHSLYLQNNPGVQLILEGHADERGTREYNLALGEDRAKSVADVVEALGVGADRIQVVSYGEERPVALGYDEASFSLNRRVEILYQ